VVGGPPWNFFFVSFLSVLHPAALQIANSCVQTSPPPKLFPKAASIFDKIAKAYAHNPKSFLSLWRRGHSFPLQLEDEYDMQAKYLEKWREAIITPNEQRGNRVRLLRVMQGPEVCSF